MSTTNTEDKILLVMLEYAVFRIKRGMSTDKALRNAVAMYVHLKKAIND